MLKKIITLVIGLSIIRHNQMRMNKLLIDNLNEVSLKRIGE